MIMFYNFLKTFNKTTPAPRGMYAVNTGLYVGEFFVYIKQTDNLYHFLSLPKMIKREIPIDKFEIGKKNKILSFVESLPKNIHEYCALQYNKG